MSLVRMLALLLVLVAMPARAATIVGESDGGWHFDMFDPGSLVPGDYRVTIDFSEPVSSFYMAFEISESYDEYLVKNGMWVGGNDLSFWSQYEDAGPLTRAAFTFSIGENYDFVSGNSRFVGGYSILGGELEYVSAGPASYSIAINRMGAVPEPATWALLILGFGAVGGALRTAQRRRLAAASDRRPAAFAAA